jgi:hypothetical protein
MGKVVTLVHPLASLQVPTHLLVSKCDLFADDPRLASVPYHLKSQLSVSDFREFVSALDCTTVKVTNNNFKGLLQLCDEFHFRDLSVQLSQFRKSRDFEEDAVLLSALEERVQQHDSKPDNFKQDTKARVPIPMTEINHSIALFDEVFKFVAENVTFECTVGQAIALSPAVREQLSVDACARTFSLKDVTAVDSIRHLLWGDEVSIRRSQTGLGRQLCSPGLELALALALAFAGTDRLDFTSFDLSMLSVEALDEVLVRGSFSIASEDALLERLLGLSDDYLPLLRRIEIGFLSTTGRATLAELFVVPRESLCCGILDFLRPPPPDWNSMIVPDFPKLFGDFKRKQFTLLWRGSRDGFAADDFHGRCDGHANTLTMILDTKGNIFGGFTPVEWESRRWNERNGDEANTWKCDGSLQSFLFTLKNPHNVPPRRFPLNTEMKERAICCDSHYGPDFYDFYVFNHCHQKSDSWTENFGTHYINDTGLDGKRFFTNSRHFKVKKIEVFEITD